MALSLVLVPAVQAALGRWGFGRTSRVLGRLSQGQEQQGGTVDAHRLAEAVGLVAARPVIGARCLGRSLVVWFLLRRRGVDARLVIGASAPTSGGLAAHAWVEVDGRPVNEAEDVGERFGRFDRARAPAVARALGP